MKRQLFSHSRTLLVVLLFVLLSGNVMWGQTSITSIGNTITENFNTLSTSTTNSAWADNSTLPGWYAKTDASTPNQYKANQGSNTVAWLYSFGATGNTDRAFGYFPSVAYTGPVDVGKGYMGWRLQNNTGKTIGSVRVIWSGEQWRKAINSNKQSINLYYQVGATITDLTSGTYILTSSYFEGPIANSSANLTLDGNDPANRVSGITIDIDVIIAPGEEIMLRWDDLNDAVNHTLAIDDISFTAKEFQNITFNSLTGKTIGDPDFNLTATASSGLQVTYTSSNTSVATVSSDVVTITGAGITTITASQTGDANYSAAVPSEQVLTVKPLVPVALEATNIGSVSFSANWSAANGAYSYEIIYTTDPSFATFTNADAGNVLTTEIATLPNTTYYYRVRSKNTGIYSDFSNTITVTTISASQTSNLIASLNGTSATLTWTNGSLSSRVVFVKEGTGAITDPENSVRYFESSDWLIKGDPLGTSGYYCVYYGQGNSVILTNLSIGTLYTVQAYEFVGNEFEETYLTAESGSNNPITFTAGGSIWVGTTSSDWNTPSNWLYNIVPGLSDDVTIPNATNYPVINQDPGTPALCHNLTLESGTELTIEAGKALTVNGVLTNNGGTLKLNSTSSGIASLILNSYVKGTGASEEIQLYLSGGGNEDDDNFSWHYISTPTASVPVSIFTGTTNDLVQFIESRATGPLMLGWVAYDGYVYTTGEISGPTFNELTPGRGYNYWDLATNTFTLSGVLNTSDTPMLLSYSGLSTSGFNLLGNPFSAGLNWDNITSDVSFPGTTSKAAYFTRDNKLCYYISGIGIPGDVSGIIPPMQGFFTLTRSSGNTINLAASARTHMNIHSRYKGGDEIPLVRLKLKRNPLATDETVVRFNNDAKSGLDYDYDAVKMVVSSASTQIFSAIDGINYAINGLPFPETFVEVPIVLNLSKDSIYTISASEIIALEDYNVTLKDNLSGFTANLKATPVVTFAAGPGTVADRFVLKISLIPTGIESSTATKNPFNIYQGSSMINIQTVADEWDGKTGTLRILDLTGKTLSDHKNMVFSKNSLIQMSAERLSGIYVVEIRSGMMRYVGKVVIRK